MSPSQPRSRSGCSACRSKRKKCDETKPNCERCESSGIQCPGYTFIIFNPTEKRSKRLKNIGSAPVSQWQNIPAETTLQVNVGLSTDLTEYGISIQESQLERTSVVVGSAGELECEGPSSCTMIQTPGKSLSISRLFKPSAYPYPIGSSGGNTSWTYLQDSSIDHGMDYNNYLWIEAQATASFGSHILTGQTHHHHTPYDSSSILGQQNSSSPAIDHRKNSDFNLDTVQEAEDVKHIIFGSLVPDRNVHSNSLAFIMESYAAWIQRTAYEPVRVARKSKDFIVKHYGESAESRLTITLMANLIRGLAKSMSMATMCASVYYPIISTLLARLHRSIALFDPHQSRECRVLEATRVLDGIVNLAHILGTSGNARVALKLIEAAAPLFRQLSGDLQEERLHLQRLLLHPADVLRDYAVMDIISSAMLPRTMSIKYDTTFDPELETSVLNFSDDTGIQWSRGIPDQITLVFARVNSLYYNSTWDSAAFDELEAMLQSFVAIPTGSSKTNAAVARAIVQECWRQAALIYLYMGLCASDSQDPRVILALSRFMSALNRVKPGRIPDSFITLGLVIAGVAARDQIDRSAILQRIRGVEEYRYVECGPGAYLENIWNTVDCEGRPAVWVDWMIWIYR